MPVRSSELRGPAGSGRLSRAARVWVRPGAPASAPRAAGLARRVRGSRRQQRSVLACRPGAPPPRGPAGRGPRAGAGAARES